MTPSSESAAPDPFPVPTPAGDARVWLHRSRSRPQALLVLGHGAGRGVDTADLQALAQALPDRGIAVALVDQPWVVAGRRVAAPPKQLDTAFLAVVPVVREELGGSLPVVVGGRSAGARVACRTAVSLDAAGVVALAFPLHPPGNAERSRIDELAGAGVPVLVLQGERDPFGGPDEVTRAVAAQRRTSSGLEPITVEAIGSADHSLRVPAKATVSAEQTLAGVVASVAGWVTELIG